MLNNCSEKTILVSIIIPVYNVKNYLDRCITSVLNQTERNFELILVDDGSTDGSSIICDKYASTDNRVQIIHQTNKGRCIARNNGLNIAKGEWIFFLDSDDWIEKDFIHTMINVYKQTGSMIITCKSQTWYEEKKALSSNDTNNITTLNIDGIVKSLITQDVVRFELWDKLIKRELLNDVRFIKGQLSEEVHIDRIIFLKTNSLSHIDKTLHNYRAQRPGNTTSKFNPSRISIFNEFDEFICDLNNMNKIELAEVIKCISMKFVILIYMEAIQFDKVNCVKLKLDKYESKYYKTAIKSRFYNNKIGLYIYRLSPMLYYFLLKFKKKLYSIRLEGGII